jgi:ribosomal protein S18 acetylase RimI-like enzyme
MDTPPALLIRAATTRDAARIAEVHVRSWQATYRGHMPPEYLDRLDPADRLPRWQQRLTEPAGDEVLVADGQDGVCGFSSFGPTRDDNDDPGQVGEVRAIYLMPAVIGTGIGRLLMDASVEHLTRAGYREVTLWVLAGNGRARRFYERAGLRPDGAVKVDDGAGFRLDEVRYRRSLP